MAKKKTEKPQREYTRRQLSQFQRQRRRQRIIFVSGVSVIAAIIVFVMLGWYLAEFRPMHQTVIEVNGTSFNMNYFIDALKVGGEGKSASDIQGMAASVVQEIEQNELVRQAAADLGITVSDDEARQRLEAVNIKVTEASLDMARGVILLEKLQNEHFTSEVQGTAAQAHIMAMFLESESRAYEIREQLEATDNFSGLAEENSLDSFTQSNGGDLGWHPESIISVMLGSDVPGEYAFGSEAGTLSQPRYDAEKYKQGGYWLVRVLERDDTSAQTQALLLSSEEEALSIKARLEGGEDLAAIAEEYSQFEESKKQGGELGIINQGEMSGPLDEYIFSPDTELNTWSEPINDDTTWTQGGYWLVKVVEKADDRELDSEDRDYLLGQAVNEWVASLWAGSSNQVSSGTLDSEKMLWAAEKAAAT